MGQAALQHVDERKSLVTSLSIVDDTVFVPHNLKSTFKPASVSASALILPFTSNIKVDPDAFGEKDETPTRLVGKTLGEAFINSPQFKALQNGVAGKSMRFPFRTKSLYSGSPVSVPSMFGEVYGDGDRKSVV